MVPMGNRRKFLGFLGFVFISFVFVIRRVPPPSASSRQHDEIKFGGGNEAGSLPASLEVHRI